MCNKEKERELFNKIFSLIKREGVEDLQKWIEDSDFFTAPASTRYHGAVEGGLLHHTINVYLQLRKLYKEFAKKKQGMDELTPEIEESIALVAVTHDICKCNFYEVQYRYNGDKYYAINDQMPMGHGEKSLYIANQFVKFSLEEALAIRWHMGGFDEAVKGGTYSYNGAQKYPLVILLHIADMLAAHLYE